MAEQEQTGTAGTGTSFSTDPPKAPDGSTIVYVGVPDLTSTQAYAHRLEAEIRFKAMDLAIARRHYGFTSNDSPVHDAIEDAVKIEHYFRTGTVPEGKPVQKQTQQGAESKPRTKKNGK